jgi:hypothetical protein
VEFATIKRVLTAFGHEGLRYAIFGAALNLRTCPLHRRSRRLSGADAGNLERVRRALSSVFDDASIDEAFTFADLELVWVPFEDLTVSHVSCIA